MSEINQIFDEFCKISDQPENFISSQKDQSDSIKNLLKNVYDFTKNQEDKSSKSNALPELIVEGFDNEQIWQQQELQNEEFLNKMLIEVSRFAVNKNNLTFEELQQNDSEPEESIEEDKEISQENQLENDEEESENFSDTVEVPSNEEEEEDEEENLNRINKKRIKKSIVDDDFFKLDEMEEFLKLEDKKFDKENNADSGNDSVEESDDDDDDDKIAEKEIDYFKADEDEDLEDERLKNPRFKDFFRKNDPEPTKHDRNEDDDEEEDNQTDEEYEDRTNEEYEDRTDNDEDENHINDDEDENKIDEEDNTDNYKSSYELREERLKEKIEKIEEKNLSEKPWPMLGEISAENRPINSLLEEVVEFDIASRPAPIITEKTSLQLDDIIRQRIKDKAFDSVERKEKPSETPFEYKKQLVLEQEKSKESLAQIYEKEYLKQQENLIPDDGEDKEEEEPELHKEVKSMMDSLFRKLDALSNYYFTPKPAIPELKIVNNLPAITMEEVAPTSTSDATLLAPEEIKNRIKGDVIGKTERTQTDKNRERRKKKKKQHVHAVINQKKNALVKKINPGLGNKYSKEKAKKDLDRVVKEKNVDKMDESVGSKSVKSSKAFFERLQDEVKTQIKGKMDAKKRKKSQAKISAKKIKL